jgi:hypothetical protein
MSSTSLPRATEFEAGELDRAMEAHIDELLSELGVLQPTVAPLSGD